jgi:hypothetical protein
MANCRPIVESPWVQVGVGHAWQHHGPEQFDRFHQAVVRRQSVIHPGKQPSYRQTLQQPFHLARNRIDAADQRQTVLKQVGRFMLISLGNRNLSYILAGKPGEPPPMRSERGLGPVNNLTGLRTRNDSVQAGIFTALEFALSPFSGALIAAVFLVQLFLFADPFSLAFFHAAFFRGHYQVGATVSA